MFLCEEYADVIYVVKSGDQYYGERKNIGNAEIYYSADYYRRELARKMDEELKPKFKLGDEVWLMVNNKAIKESIDSFDMHHGQHGVTIKYNILINGQYRTFDEWCLFATKEELLNSL